MTIRSPRMTLRSISRSTWKSPNHLFMPTMSMATSVWLTDICERSIWRSEVMDSVVMRGYLLWPVLSRRSMNME